MRKKKIYMTGIDLENEYVYGKDEAKLKPLTFNQAKKDLKNFDSEESVVIYRLVPVDPKEI